MHLSEVTWTDADATDATVALLPVGSTEQHGPHAPLGTDHIAAEAIAEEGAAQYREEVVIAPPIPVGVAAEHRQFTGTLWVEPDTFRAYVRDTIESLASHGWHRVVLVNAHGGNTAALREVCEDIVRSEEAYAVLFTWFDAIDPDDLDLPAGIEMGHGGSLETSLVMWAHPELVHEDRLETASDGAPDGWGEWVSGANLAADTAEFSDNGAVGDPAEATSAIGETLVQASGGALATLLDSVESRDLTRPDHR